MSNTLKWMGLAATIVIVIILPVYVWAESSTQDSLLEDYHTNAVVNSTEFYAENCAVCHGAAGEGIADNPALNSEAVSLMSENDLLKVIARGRDNTQMAAWAMEEGGIFSNSQVDDFAIFLQQVNWDYVEQRVADLGLTPPALIEMELSEDMLSQVSALPDGEYLSEGLTIYAENCAACHGSNGAGSVIAPAIDSNDLRNMPQSDMVQLVSNGVPGTLMAGWDNSLTAEQIDAVVDMIYRWPELIQAGIDFPEAEIMDIPSTPEMIAAGGELFNIACKSCHGLDGYGTPMAPAVNNQLFLSETPDAAIYQIIAGGIPGTLMPAWGSRLDDQKLQSIVAYLRNFEPTAPAIVPPITEH